jgi:hypothetical protein
MSTAAKLSMSDDLLHAFLNTDYLVEIDGHRLCVNVGKVNAELDLALNQRSWAILTAENPGAQKLDEKGNRSRRKALEHEVIQAGLKHYSSVHRAQGNNWDDEHGLMLLDPASAWLHGRASRFGQLGIVHGRPGQPAELWLYALITEAPAHPHVVQVSP